MSSTGKKREGYAVELYFDSTAEECLNTFRESMYRQAGVTPMLGKMNDRPHISLAVFGCIDAQPLLEVCTAFFENVATLPFILSAVGTFPTPDNVLYLAPVPTQSLLDLHLRFHEKLLSSHLRTSGYYLPGNWVPHCTVEFELPDADFLKAFEYYRRDFAPVTGSMTRAGVVGFRPVEYMIDYELKGNLD